MISSRNLTALALALAVLVPGSRALADGLQGKRVMYVNALDTGDEWGDATESTAKIALLRQGAEVRVFRLGVTRTADRAAGEKAAARAKEAIDTFKPDVIIAAEEPAVRYVAVAFKGGPAPFVLCGLDADAPGLPNATGIGTVVPGKALLDVIRDYAPGARIAYLGADGAAGHAEAARLKKEAGGVTVERYVKTFAEWKAAYKALQGEADAIVLGDVAEVDGWVPAEAVATAGQGKVISGTVYPSAAPVAMVAVTRVPTEHGAWAAKTAAALLGGAAPGSIPPAAGKLTRTYLNVRLAAPAGVVFKPALLKDATVLK